MLHLNFLALARPQQIGKSQLNANPNIQVKPIAVHLVQFRPRINRRLPP